MTVAVPDYILSLEQVSMADVPEVGGKNASLGEMIGALAVSGGESARWFRHDG